MIRQASSSFFLFSSFFCFGRAGPHAATRLAGSIRLLFCSAYVHCAPHAAAGFFLCRVLFVSSPFSAARRCLPTLGWRFPTRCSPLRTVGSAPRRCSRPYQLLALPWACGWRSGDTLPLCCRRFAVGCAPGGACPNWLLLFLRWMLDAPSLHSSPVVPLSRQAGPLLSHCLAPCTVVPSQAARALLPMRSSAPLPARMVFQVLLLLLGFFVFCATSGI